VRRGRDGKEVKVDEVESTYLQLVGNKGRLVGAIERRRQGGTYE